MAGIARNSEAPVQKLDGGVIRRILSHTESMMVVEITFPAGGVGAVHTHEHIQSSYVKSGVFEYIVGDEKVVVKEGDSLTFLPNEPHGCTCLEAGVLVDTFSPRREDFLK
jgi:quercetin dioxygenase-like cupin family protein